MRYQNRLMSSDEEANPQENTVIVDQTESSGRPNRLAFSRDKSIVWPLVLVSLGLLVVLVFFRSAIYHYCIDSIYGRNSFRWKTPASKLKHQTRQHTSFLHYHH